MAISVRLSLLVSFLAIHSGLWSQSRHTLNGYIRDQENGEMLYGATVYIPEISNGTVSNAYGFYALNLPEGTYTVKISYVGYQSVTQTVNLDQNKSLNVDLVPESQAMEEVVITDTRDDDKVTSIQMSRNTIDIEQVKKLPSLFGEADLIKTVQLMPGVISAGEGTSSFFVRGGSADQNLILIDEAPIYDPSHFFGLFSVFNADVIKSSDLYKGGVPAQYGGRLSSILDVRTKDGNNRQFGGSLGISNLAARVMLEGPIKPEKSSYLFSARRSYADVFLRLAGEDNTVWFHDFNAKVNWRTNERNRFFVSGYLGRDAFRFDDDFGFDWGNSTLTFRWNHLFSDRLFSNLSVIGSIFDYGLEGNEAATEFKWTSNIQQVSIKQDFDYYLNPSNHITFGYHGTWMRFSPGTIEPTAEGSIFQTTKLDRLFALDHAIYLGNEQTISEKLMLQYGLRLSVFQSMGKTTLPIYAENASRDNPVVEREQPYGPFETMETFVNLEPRFSARYLLNQESSLKASYQRMVQNVHLVSSGTVPLPFNTWSPSYPYLDPQIADQVALGYFKNFKDNTYELSVETYYKDMQNVTDFADNASIFFNQDIALEYRQGSSWSTGIETMLQKKKGDFTGFVTYTLSKTEREVPDVNLGRPFLANYDRRHNITAAATYELNSKWTFGANFVYSTGRPITLPEGWYTIQENYNVPLITERNGYRLPDFHRLDLSATLTPRKNRDRRWKSSWVFSIYNVYSRKNPFTIVTSAQRNDDGDIINPNVREARMIYLFPILPSVTYNVRF